jgi:hypothetical protein
VSLLEDQSFNKIDIKKPITLREPITTIQYLGGKGRLIGKIIPLISEKFGQPEKFVDLFAGTGSVAYAMQPYAAEIFSNDLQQYSSIILNAVLNGANLSDATLKKVFKRAAEHASELKDVLAPALEIERSFRSQSLSEKTFKQYKKFCDETPHVYNPTSTLQCFKPLAKLAKQIKPGKQPVATVPPCLFITYYANTYFGLGNL